MSRDSGSRSLGVEGHVPLLSDLEEVDDSFERESTSSTTWEKSPTSPVLTEYEKEYTSSNTDIQQAGKNKMMAPISEGSESPTSPTFQSHSASARLLSEDGEQTVVGEEEEEKLVTPAPEEEKKPFITAEHKIAFSHFLVRYTLIYVDIY